MAGSRLSILSNKPRNLARRVASRVNRSGVVVRAFEFHEVAREPAHAFYARMSVENEEDIDLRSDRWSRSPPPPDFQ
ncbi:plasmid stabilization protein [Rhizobium jaguaris]|uniref:Plasmid stabilization protein n=1 Tax=Rhizobium jaguaris TaxID=1312183 RepID=A0A387FZS2_9HYPH|nr:plasmid stabilization protein [Rhizobium jaguaris]AYG63823.1 plasmid stabilization protein [Rhizobium jaguaris]